MSADATGDVTRLLEELNAGNADALPVLLPLVYDELRRLASRHLGRERQGHTLQPTALVHEAYLKLVGQGGVRFQNRAHFFGVAAQAMRRILIDQARARLSQKRGGDRHSVPVDEAMLVEEPRAVDLVALDIALTELAAFDPDQAKLVELRFFAGCTIEETAEILGVSDGTVKREWRLARAWLNRAVDRQLR
jgi:RNA polymerase sigma factor (TIGR02999 family)